MGNIAAIVPMGRQDVYNMTVEKYHNFLIAGGIVLKNCDALRYLCAFRAMGPEAEEEDVRDDDAGVDYDAAMLGGELSGSYLEFGG